MVNIGAGLASEHQNISYDLEIHHQWQKMIDILCRSLVFSLPLQVKSVVKLLCVCLSLRL